VLAFSLVYCSCLFGTSLLHLSLLIGVPQLVVFKARATSGIRASQVHRVIVCQFQENWLLFGGDRVSISEQRWDCLWDRVSISEQRLDCSWNQI